MHYSLQRALSGTTTVTHGLTITGEGLDDLGPKIGPHISDDFPETIAEVFALA